MPRPGRRLHVLRRPKLRQSWNKYNLYNLYRQREPKIGISDYETFFQQKWKAKGLLRAYHGEHIRERDWERMFSRRLLSVVDMDPKYMAQFDGSEKAAGRGSGKDETPRWDDRTVEPRTITPYMNMAFAPLERRLDIAVFRAMFASSARQARQFCVHGAVKVNGRVMPHPSYKLNPGDMFQVDPEKVLFATGATKSVQSGKSQPQNGTEEASSSEPAEAEETPVEEEAATQEALEQDPDTTDKPEATPVDTKPTRKAIQALVKQAKEVLLEEKLGVHKKRELRAFIKDARKLVTNRPNATPADLANELNNMMAELNLSKSPEPEAEVETTEKDNVPESLEELTPDEIKMLERRIAKEEENPYDPSKPYATPWRPRPFMAPFAFIPQYMEVNQKVCSAIYLRHPVARVGSAEVPTPFGYRINQLAFNWYLRRR